MRKFIYVTSVVLLWLAAGGGAIWWALTAFEIYEAEWAMLMCLAFLIPEMIVTFVLHRVWRSIWVRSRGRESAGPGPVPDAGRRAPRSAAPDSGHPQWLRHMKTERERRD